MLSKASLNDNPLLNALLEGFDLEELRTLCFDLQIDFDSLRGEGKEGKARELILYCHRRSQLDRLVEKMVAERPHLAHLANIPAQELAPALIAADRRSRIGVIAGLLVLVALLAFGVYWYLRPHYDVLPAQAGETLALVAAFRGPAEGDLLPEQRIAAALQALRPQVAKLNLRTELVSHRVIASANEAQEWGRLHRAAIVIWGWYDAAAVSANLTLPDKVSSPALTTAPSADRLAGDAGWQLNQLLPERVELVSQLALGWLAFLDQDCQTALQLWEGIPAALKSESHQTQLDYKLDEVLYLSGVAAWQCGDEERALSASAQAEQVNPDHWLAVFQNGNNAYRNGDLATAFAKAEHIFDDAPASETSVRGQALLLAARVRREQGNLPQAIAIAKTATEVAPNDAEIWNMLSDLYLRDQNWAQAAQAAEQALALSFPDPAADFNLGRASLHLGKWAQAESAYQAGLAKLQFPAHQGTLNAVRAELEQDRSNFPTLASDIDRLLAILPASPP